MYIFSQKKQYVLKGFTLVEVLVSLFVFGIMMIAASGIFVNAFNGYRQTRAVQKDAENAQFTLNILAKELRTSSVVRPTTGPFPVSSQSVQFYDHSQSVCFAYRINNGALQVARVSATSVSNCSSMVFASYTPVSTGTVSGSFQITPSTAGPPIRVGRVTISLDIREGARHFVRIQSSVSLRDYGNIGL